jgi:hypothetical protein
MSTFSFLTGYQIEAYSTGTEEWPELRKVSVWQTVNALEQVVSSRFLLIYFADLVVLTRNSVKKLFSLHNRNIRLKNESRKMMMEKTLIILQVTEVIVITI